MKSNMTVNQVIIRPDCLQPYSDNWPQPTGNEIREAMRLARFSGSEAAATLGLSHNGGRTIRRWVSEDLAIPYTAWAVLCEFAGFGIIWR